MGRAAGPMSRVPRPMSCVYNSQRVVPQEGTCNPLRGLRLNPRKNLRQTGGGTQKNRHGECIMGVTAGFGGRPSTQSKESSPC